MSKDAEHEVEDHGQDSSNGDEKAIEDYVKLVASITGVGVTSYNACRIVQSECEATSARQRWNDRCRDGNGPAEDGQDDQQGLAVSGVAEWDQDFAETLHGYQSNDAPSCVDPYVGQGTQYCAPNLTKWAAPSYDVY